DRHGQPEARCAVRVPHTRAMPLPPGPLRDFKSLFNPRAETIPAGITGLRRQISEDQPGVFVALLPAGQQRAGHLVAGKSDAHATGMAHPRYTTLTASTTNRSPKVVASMARANWVPCHQLTTHPRRGAKQVSTCSAWRLGPRLRGVS